MNFKKILFVSALFSLLIISACQDDKVTTLELSPAMVVSVSSDGKFVVSSHQKNEIVLWDIEHHSNNLISNKGNIYSAYFIRNTDKFMWQGLDDVVHVQKLGGGDVKSFAHFPTYGHIMNSNLEHYFSGDINWSIFYGEGNSSESVKDDGDSPSFRGSGKLLNLSLSDDGRYLVSAGDGFDVPDNRPIEMSPPVEKEIHYSDYAGVVLWDVATRQPLVKLPGNTAKTNAAISPDGKYVVSGCENGKGFVWDSFTGNRLVELGSIFHGITIRIGDDVENWQHDKSDLIPYPKDLGSHHGAKLTTKFIANNSTYLQFLKSAPYAVLYTINNPLPVKYLSLGRDPFPSVNGYDRNAAIDTAPAVGVLVTGQAHGGGINVYKYHPDKQELKKVWVAK